jgi:hypothetical protein
MRKKDEEARARVRARVVVVVKGWGDRSHSCSSGDDAGQFTPQHPLHYAPRPAALAYKYHSLSLHPAPLLLRRAMRSSPHSLFVCLSV